MRVRKGVTFTAASGLLCFSTAPPTQRRLRISDRTTGVVLRGTESLLTHRWREMDSNPRSPGHSKLCCRAPRSLLRRAGGGEVGTVVQLVRRTTPSSRAGARFEQVVACWAARRLRLLTVQLIYTFALHRLDQQLHDPKRPFARIGETGATTMPVSIGVAGASTSS